VLSQLHDDGEHVNAYYSNGFGNSKR
jgi:hypothetical protein